MDNPAGTKDDDIKDAKTAYATFLIPEIWSFGEYAPVVLDTGTSCSGDQNDIIDEWIETWLPADKDLKSYWACIDGKTYYLAAAKGTDAEGCNGADCQTVQFEALPGIEKLDDYGLDVKDIITGSVNSYKKSNNKNGYIVDTVSEDMLEDMYEQKYTTPGVFTIPVCSEDEAGDNWWAHSNHGKGRDPKNYPCD